MKGFALLVVGLLGGSCACSEQTPETAASIPAGWTTVPPPEAGTDAALCANWARDAYALELSSDSTTLLISPDPGWNPLDTLELEGGRLTSENRGEFGGDVWWEPKTGARQRVAELNLLAFVPAADAVFGLEGLAHMMQNSGQLVRFDSLAGGGWNATSVLDLGEAPHSFTRAADDTLLVVTSGALIAVRHPGYRRVLHRNDVWPVTYSHSIVRDRAGVVYVGMRSGFARLKPHSGRFLEEWLVPAECPRRRVTSDLGLCECVPPTR